MTSQLTPERSTSLASKAEETRERPLLLQPWFLMAILSMVAIVLVVLFS
ncbi:MAG: hypothetical protein JOY55_10400 [Mycobacterium sp.]|jgi:hypothetical protein|nr:hypothetical protein [Mycobacterium sp.]MBV8292206.1 hypothetical protein [Mycobacterium sp.]